MDTLERINETQAYLKYISKEHTPEPEFKGTFLDGRLDGNVIRVIGRDILDAMERAVKDAGQKVDTVMIAFSPDDTVNNGRTVIHARSLRDMARLYKDNVFKLTLQQPERIQERTPVQGRGWNDPIRYEYRDRDLPIRVAYEIEGERVSGFFAGAYDCHFDAVLNPLAVDNSPLELFPTVTMSGLSDGTVYLAESSTVRAGLKGVKPSQLMQWGDNVAVKVSDLRAAMKNAVLTAVIMNAEQDQVMVISIDKKVLGMVKGDAVDVDLGEAFNVSSLENYHGWDDALPVVFDTAAARHYIEQQGTPGDGYTAVTFCNHDDPKVQRAWGSLHSDGLTITAVIRYEDGQELTVTGPVCHQHDIPQRGRTLLLASGEVESEPAGGATEPVKAELTLEGILRLFFSRKGVDGEEMLKLAGKMRDRWQDHYFESLGRVVTVDEFETAVTAIWLSGDFFAQVHENKQPGLCHHELTYTRQDGDTTITICAGCHKMLYEEYAPG